MIHRPDVWQKLQEERLEAQEMGFDEIVERVPESAQELADIEKAFRDLEMNPNTTVRVLDVLDPNSLGELGDEE